MLCKHTSTQAHKDNISDSSSLISWGIAQFHKASAHLDDLLRVSDMSKHRAAAAHLDDLLIWMICCVSWRTGSTMQRRRHPGNQAANGAACRRCGRSATWWWHRRRRRKAPLPLPGGPPACRSPQPQPCTWCALLHTALTATPTHGHRPHRHPHTWAPPSLPPPHMGTAHTATPTHWHPPHRHHHTCLLSATPNALLPL